MLGRDLGRLADEVQLAAQALDHVGDQLRQLTGRQRRVHVEGFVLGRLVPPVEDHVQELDALDLHRVRQGEGHALLPGHRQARGHLAAGQVRLDLVGVQVVPGVAHRRLHLVGGLELAIAVDHEVLGRHAVHQPRRHAGGRRFGALQQVQVDRRIGLHQQRDQFVSLADRARIHHQQALFGRDPHPQVRLQREGARQQLQRGLLLHVALLLLAGPAAGLELDPLDHLLDLLPHHRAGQHPLLHAQAQQPVAVDLLQQPGAGLAARRHPAGRQGFRGAAGRETLVLEGVLELLGIGLPVVGQAVNDQVLEHLETASGGDGARTRQE